MSNDLRVTADEWLSQMIIDAYAAIDELPSDLVNELPHDASAVINNNLHAKDPHKWVFREKHHSSGLVISKAQFEGSSLLAFRGDKKNIAVSAEKFFKTVIGVDLVHEYDQLFKKGCILKTFWGGGYKSADNLEDYDAAEATYARYKAPPMWDRDFVFVERRKVLNLDVQKDPAKGSESKRHFVITCVSVDEEDDDIEIPEEMSREFWSAVRAKIMFGGWLITDGDLPGTCNVTYLAQVDPKGWIPKKIVNMVGVEQPLCIAAVEKLLT